MAVSRRVASVRRLSDYQLWSLMDAAGFAIYRLRELELKQFNLTIEQAALLRLLKTVRRGMTVKEIKAITLRQQNSISILINRMLGTGLVMKERRFGQRELTVLISDEGRGLLKRIPTTSLERTFVALPQERREFARSLRTLGERARSLLVPDVPPFMQYIARDTHATRREDENDTSSPSDYILWSHLDSTRFAISRLRELELARFGLTVEQASILRLIVDAGGSLTTKNIEDMSLRQHHSVSTLVNRMMKMGLVGRERRQGENRFRIFISEKGRTLLREITTVAIDMTFSALTESGKHQLAISLRSLHLKARELLGASVSQPHTGVTQAARGIQRTEGA